jgi:hypothetical protein
LFTGYDQKYNSVLTGRIDFYPNPAIDRVTFRIPVNQDGLFEIRIYDIQGRQVDILTKGQFQEGVMEVTWITGKLPAGMYLAVVKTIEGTRMLKVILD